MITAPDTERPAVVKRVAEEITARRAILYISMQRFVKVPGMLSGLLHKLMRLRYMVERVAERDREMNASLRLLHSQPCFMVQSSTSARTYTATW